MEKHRAIITIAKVKEQKKEMKQGMLGYGGSKWYTEDERHVAQLLLQLRDSKPRPLSWGCTRKRSAIQDTPPPLVFLQTPLHHGGGAAPSRDTKTVTVPKTEAPSPATTLSFSLTESDEKLKRLRKKRYRKKKKEYDLKYILEDLTKSQASLSEELYNVMLYYDKMKALNLKLKAWKQELINGSKSEYKNPTLEFGGSMQSVHVNGSVNPSNSMAQNEKHKQPQMEMQMPSTPHIPLMMPNQNQMSEPFQIRNSEGVVIVSGHPTTSLQMPFSSSNALGHVNGNGGPLALPDLNISPEKITQMDTSQPFHEAMANRDLNRAIAAQARHKRILICRLKNPIGHSRPRYSHR
ncbi:hypothetical protein E2542_SST14679 [Spatholobus suberectus]|nr:hypothetical protein E2542_SST14679 [Spatholobus suberectus]